MVHPDALDHFNSFTHTESIIVEARNWATGFGREFEVIDRDYMGLDLGELLTYSAVVKNPAKSDQIRSHSRSHGYLMEPLKRYKRWLKSYKTNAMYASERTMTGSNSMDPAIFREYAIHRLTSKHGSRLSAFYNRRIMKYRKWQLKLASKKVLDSSVDELLQMVGCSSGKRWDFNNGIGPVIGIGLGQFRFHQDSVHAKFAKYLTQKARAIGIVVVGVNEYYTSQKCPRCLSRLYEVDRRVKYCEECRMFFNRDNAAAQNISTLVIMRANKQPRPPQLMEPSDAELGIPPAPPPDPGPGPSAKPSRKRQKRSRPPDPSA